jgi:hypothetical protein
VKVHIRQFEEYSEIYLNDTKFWEGAHLTPKIINLLLMSLGVESSLENVRGNQYE